VVGVVPFLAAIYLSTRSFDLASEHALSAGVGADNYIRLWRDPVAGHAIWVSVVFAVASVTLEVVLGTAAALGFGSYVARKSWRYALCLLPAFVAPIVVALTWKFVLQSEFGVGTYLLRQLGFYERTSILSDAGSALPTLIAIDVWQWTPFIFAMLTAAIATQPRRPLEVAALDGAGRFRTAMDVTLPHIAPLLVILAGVRFVDAFREFEKVYLLTGGGPGITTDMLSTYTWRIAFREWNLGFASALALVGYGAAVLIALVIINAYRRGARTYA
jgi:multiple sugar transport system permease protein